MESDLTKFYRVDDFSNDDLPHGTATIMEVYSGDESRRMGTATFQDNGALKIPGKGYVPIHCEVEPK